MTLALLNDLNQTSFEGNVITVYPKRSSLNSDDCRIDWSSSYFHWHSTKASISLKLQRNQFARRFRFGRNLQTMGVETHFQGDKMTLENSLILNQKI
jgi:hypothetical protein